MVKPQILSFEYNSLLHYLLSFLYSLLIELVPRLEQCCAWHTLTLGESVLGFKDFSHVTFGVIFFSSEHFQVQVGERHPPGWAPQAGVVRWKAGQLHLLHLQCQSDGCPALPGVIAQGEPLYLCPLTTCPHATGWSRFSRVFIIQTSDKFVSHNNVWWLIYLASLSMANSQWPQMHVGEKKATHLWPAWDAAGVKVPQDCRL